VSMYVLIISAE